MIGQQEVGNVKIQSKQSRIIEQAVNRLKSHERPAITCGLLVSPVGQDVDESFEWPVIDRWIAEALGKSVPEAVTALETAAGTAEREQNWRYKARLARVRRCASYGPRQGDSLLLRGGSFGDQASSGRSAGRSFNQPADRGFFYGFRPSRTYR